MKYKKRRCQLLSNEKSEGEVATVCSETTNMCLFVSYATENLPAYNKMYFFLYLVLSKE